MPFPTIEDDGSAVELDLHGATIREAESMIQRLAILASQRGRETLRIVHGISTSEGPDDRRTIRGVLLTMLEHGALDPYVTNWFTFEGATVLSLRISGATNDERIGIHDLM